MGREGERVRDKAREREIVRERWGESKSEINGERVRESKR